MTPCPTCGAHRRARTRCPHCHAPWTAVAALALGLLVTGCPKPTPAPEPDPHVTPAPDPEPEPPIEPMYGVPGT